MSRKIVVMPLEHRRVRRRAGTAIMECLLIVTLTLAILTVAGLMPSARAAADERGAPLVTESRADHVVGAAMLAGFAGVCVLGSSLMRASTRPARSERLG